ncbi:MAG: imidazoleglycerol-phosphate dehydratase HisB [Myxococcota bacterium]
MSRSIKQQRATKETQIEIEWVLDGRGETDIETGVGFLDHMLEAFGRHGRFDLRVRARGDLHVDPHHTVEDTALTLGAGLELALGDRRGLERYGHAYVPMDEALARAAWDLGGRPWPEVELGLRLDHLGGVSRHDWRHFFQSLAIASRSALHVDVLRGEHDHHRLESAFKATAVGLRRALVVSGGEVPSTKGSL